MTEIQIINKIIESELEPINKYDLWLKKVNGVYQLLYFTGGKWTNLLIGELDLNNTNIYELWLLAGHTGSKEDFLLWFFGKALEARLGAEVARQGAEIAMIAAELYKLLAEEAANMALSAQNSSEQARDEAVQAKNSAIISANNSAQSEQSAIAAKISAQLFAILAQNAADNTVASVEGQLLSYVDSAQASAGTATIKALESSTSAGNALILANLASEAANLADAAKQWIISLHYLSEETDPTVPAWAKTPLKPIYSYTEILNTPTTLSAFTNDLGNYGGWITGINSSMVTNALGYTPLPTRTFGSAANNNTGDFAAANHILAITTITGLTDALNSKINSTLLGVPNGIAELDNNGFVKNTQLPSYVDDILEGSWVSDILFNNLSGVTYIPEIGKIYVDVTTNKTYRWGGTIYVVVSDTIALGETSNTAYRGDRGKIAYDHSQTAHQSILNGTGLVRTNGTSITYDNTSYVSGTPWTGLYLPLTGGTVTGETNFTAETYNAVNILGFKGSYNEIGFSVWTLNGDNHSDYGINFIGNLGANRKILRVGVETVSNGFTVNWDHSLNKFNYVFNQGDVAIGGDITSTKFIKLGGTSSQILMADGSTINNNFSIIGWGDKHSSIDAGTVNDLSITDDYLYVCVTTGSAGSAKWKRMLMFESL